MKAKLVGLKRKAEDSPQNAAKKKKTVRPTLGVSSAPAIVNGSASAATKASPPASNGSAQRVEKVLENIPCLPFFRPALCCHVKIVFFT